MKFKGKVALVTGGSSGIGRAIVERFLTEGARVYFCGRDPEKGASTLRALDVGAAATFASCDIADEGAAQRLVEAAAAWGGRLDLVINNAGFGARRSGVARQDSPGLRWRKVLGGNLDGAYFVSAYALPHLKRAGGGAIVSISSTATFHGNWGSYTVAKAGVEALTRALAAEGGPHGIRANAVSPGWIKTFDTGSSGGETWEKQASLLGRMGRPAEIAAAVVFLASDEAAFVTGQTLVVDGGLVVTDYPSLPFLEAAGGWQLFSGMLEAKP